MAKLVEIANISKIYTTFFGRETCRAVLDVNLSINSGSIYGLLGQNGAGKTTLIKMICGLINPTEGSILVNGYNTRTHPEPARAKLGAVLEGNRNVHWRMSPLENLCYFGLRCNQSKKDILKRGERLLTNLNLMEKRDALVGDLSRGMQQKVAIAVSLISDPEVLLLDEPTLGLDIETSMNIRTYLLELAKEGKAILLTTHQMDLAEFVCDTVGIIKRGKLIRESSLRDNRNDPPKFSLRDFYLGQEKDKPVAELRK